MRLSVGCFILCTHWDFVFFALDAFRTFFCTMPNCRPGVSQKAKPCRRHSSLKETDGDPKISSRSSCNTPRGTRSQGWGWRSVHHNVEDQSELKCDHGLPKGSPSLRERTVVAPLLSARRWVWSR